MDDYSIKLSIDDVKVGKLTRRDLMTKICAAGFTLPAASQLLMWHGLAMAQPAPQAGPKKAGGGGTLKYLIWQAPTLLNPHFAPGLKDQIACRVFYEPLAGWDKDGDLIPYLAAEIPTRENGGVSRDGMEVVWRLKTGVKWHDGVPFTADDVVFTWEFARNPETAAVTSGAYKDIEVTKLDANTVKVRFATPTPFWADAFVGVVGMILPKHHFEKFMGKEARNAPQNLRPIGTSAFKIVDFRPGDIVLAERNLEYHVPTQPYFDAIEMKGGGDAVSAARAVVQTGQFDYAWGMHIEEEVLKRLETGGRGKFLASQGGSLEFILLNTTDPWTEIDGERSNPNSKHPILSDATVRKAIHLCVDRDAIQKFIMGRGGTATSNFVNSPARFQSDRSGYSFDLDQASQLLESAGWKRGKDAIREKDGVRLKLVFQTAINGPRQKIQAIIKSACQKVGIELELKSVTPSVFFSADVANPDTYTKFYCDMQMYTQTQPQPDPERFANQCVSWEIASKSNNWLGRNISRFKSPEVDAAYKQAQQELDPTKRALLFKTINDRFCESDQIIPLFVRNAISAAAQNLVIDSHSWDVSGLANWHRI